jgi:transposase
VCNAAHMRNVPGRKTDIKDCQWIAELHEHGLLRPSFIPGQQVAALRARTRYRKKLIEHRASEGQRLPEVLEDAGIKIDSVASELLGVSGREMIEALIGGERDPWRLAQLAKGRLRAKLDELQMACDGRFTGGHAGMCQLHLDAYDRLTAEIATLDQLVAQAAAPFEAIIARLVTIPGIGPRIAQVIVAETGGDMTRFASSGRAGPRRQRVRRKAQEDRRPQGQRAPALGHGRSGLGVLTHRHPPRRPVPAARPPVRQAEPQKSRSRRRPHHAGHLLGGHEV